MSARETPAPAVPPAAAAPPALREALAALYPTIGYAQTLARRDPGAVRLMLDAHLALGLTRTPGTPAIGVYTLHAPGEPPCTVLDVVTDDQPFLVESLRIALERQGRPPRALAHPIVRAARDGAGTLRAIGDPNGAGAALLEAWMHFELPVAPGSEHATLRAAAARVLAQVRAVVADWAAMRARMLALAAQLEGSAQPVPDTERLETVAFLRWLADDHYTYLAAHEYALGQRAEFDLLRARPGTGLGLLRPGPVALDRRLDTLIPAALRERAHERTLLVLTKSSARSPVHRPAQMDYVGVRRFDAAGRLRGESRFLGLYTSSAYQTRPQDIPLLRRKVEQVLAASKLPAGGHSMKALVHVLETFPREEMLQARVPELTAAALGVLAVQDLHRVRLFVRREVFGRFATALLYVPRDRYRTELRELAQRALMDALEGESAEFYTQFSEAAQVRVYFVIRIRPGATPRYDVAALEAAIAQAMLTWRDRFEALAAEQGFAQAARWLDAFPPGYQADTTPAQALADLRALAARAPGAPLALELADRPGGYTLRVRGEGEPPALSDVLPPLEHFGLRVREARPYELRPAGGAPAFVLDFELDVPAAPPAAQVRARFEEALARVLAGDAEDDALSRLVLAARLDWREVTLVRAILKHLLQLGVPFSQAYMEQCLARHGELVRHIVDLHHLRHDPHARSGHAAERAGLEAAIGEALDGIAALDEDRILRRVYGHVQAMVRTNYFQRAAGGGPKPYLAFKLDPAGLAGVPEPRPFREIFVYAPDVEGVHLRGGPVARGGIRHSDRREDFRTEILGLMKAQMVKNAVIVPVGGKGGFVVKRPLPAQRPPREAAVRACYATFIRGLLDLTDNRAGERVVPPREVVRHDGDDPYLVVAADKGTAQFSDLANAIAAEYGYWLGDAFASGGRTGYDHKAMGITARGAWESVKRHFREIGLDHHAPFTVAGIGDMSGDVFGNGMLYTDRIRLVAAFDHRHIFLDPDPDPAVSHAERQRLYALPRSSWADYDPARISAGGGVYPRTAKEVALSEPVRRVLGVGAARLSPPELIQAILRAPVDLLWNGGIGTYVKATSESHAEVGDRANDAVRVNGAQLRCKVVGEGGNLGFTQFGRIEYARTGGRINTDAIDNSAGVDASDHEVNLKILLGAIERAGTLTRASRNRLLRAMQADVARAVLEDNYGQALTLSVEAAQAPYLLAEHARLIRALEAAGTLRRRLEHLPSDAELDARAAAGAGLSRPELAVLLAYAKIALYRELAGADLLADPELAPLLALYFPPRLRRRHARALARHPLAREILATYLANQLVNRMGPTFPARVRDEVGADAPATVRAAAIAARLFDLPGLWAQIEALDDQVPGALQVELLVDTRRLLERASAWLLRRPHEAPLARRAGPGALAALVAVLPELLGQADAAALAQRTLTLTQAGTPAGLAGAVARLDLLYCALDIAALARWRAARVPAVGAVYFALSDLLQVPWLRGAIRALPRLHHFQRKARTALRDELYAQLARLTAEVMAGRGTDPAGRLAAWRAGEGRALRHYDAVLAEIRTGKGADLAGLTVALGELRALGRE